MRNIHNNLITLATILILASCNTDKTTTTTEEKQEQGTEEMKTISIEGEVKEVNQGKDGYTAKLITKENEVYFATISIPNLKDPKQFRAVKAGEIINVQGEFWKMGDDNRITVRELKTP